MTTQTQTLTQLASDAVEIKEVATVAFKNAANLPEKIMAALNALAKAAGMDFASGTIKLQACTVLAQAVLENGGVYRFNHDLNWNGFSEGELKTLTEYGLKVTPIPKKFFSLLKIQAILDHDDKGKEFIAWQAWALENGEAVRIAKPKAEKKPEAIDYGTILNRFKIHGDLTKAQTQVLISAFLELQRLKGIN